MNSNSSSMLGRHRNLGRDFNRYWVGRHDYFEPDFDKNKSIRLREKKAWKKDQGV